ncbi:MAG: SHOCT domain-containing protein [Methanobacteriaceae archaeon]
MVVGHHEGNKIELRLEKDGLMLKESGRVLGWTKGEKFVEYDDITGIEFKKGVIWGDLLITASGMKIEVERIKKNEGDAFVTVLRDRLEENRKQKYEKTETISPMDEIKKAKELLDAGAITEEEYENIKKKYL